MELLGCLGCSTCCVVDTTGIFSEKASLPPMYVSGVTGFARLRRRQNSQTPRPASKATPTTAPAIPAFAPVERDEEDEDGASDSPDRNELPVGLLMVSISDIRLVGSPVCVRKENSENSDSTSGKLVGIVGVDTGREFLVTPVTGAVWLASMNPIESVAKPGTGTAELMASTQNACHHATASVTSTVEQRLRRHGVISEMMMLDLPQ